MKKRIFAYAVIVHNEIKNEDGSPTKGGKEYASVMITEPSYILAKNERDVVFQVTRKIPEEYASEPDNVEILIRPF